MNTVSEEQVLFNKLNWENQQMILKIMKCLQPCELKEDEEIVYRKIRYNINHFENIREYLEIFSDDVYGKIEKIIDKIDDLESQV